MADSTAAQVTQQNWRLETWFKEIPKDQLTKLKVLFDETHKANKSLQVFSPKTLPFADAIHFADCVLGMKIIFGDNSGIDTLYDLGAGAGFPGLIGAILYPDKKFVLVDQDKSKIDHLTECVNGIGLRNVELKCCTIEALPANSIKYAVTRGVSNISKLILASRKCVVMGGVVYHMKSENWGMEVADIPSQLCSVWSPGLVSEYRLPIGEVRFAVVKTDKIA
jgi:16S rRNA (guanine527-N7)-methyltransferase